MLSSNIKCKYLNSNICLLASEIAQKDIIITEKTCEFCTNKANPPQSINEVVISISISGNKDNKILQNKIKNKYGHLLRKEMGKATPESRKRLDNVMDGNGVGSQLWKLLEKLGINHNVACGCLYWAERMNLWGPKLCDKNRTQIIDHMKNSAKNYGWGDIGVAVIKAVTNGIAFRLSILDPYGSLLDEAIRLAKEVDASVKKN